MSTSYAWSLILEDIAYLIGEEGPGGLGREPIGTRGLADRLKVSRSTLLRWLDGSEPRHSDGEMILETWTKLGGKSREFAPRERRSLSAADMRS